MPFGDRPNNHEKNKDGAALAPAQCAVNFLGDPVAGGAGSFYLPKKP
jgi:hypothetical protein